MDFRSDILVHRDYLYRLALSLIGDSAEAEDVVQDVMLKAWEHRAEWESIEKPLAWLTQVAKNLAMDKKKKSRPQPLPEEGSPGWQSPHMQSMPQQGDGIALMMQLISALPHPLDDLVRLRDVEGFTYSEIATQLQLTEDQVRVYLHRARQKLKAQYEAIQNYGL